MELTILMPCLNEENTIEGCVRQAVSFLHDYHIDGEVLVIDNGSTDASAKRALHAGAKVLSCDRKGYGNALGFGLKHSAGKYVIMADCDCSYSFEELQPFLDKLRAGADMVIGDRFAYPMEKGAMGFSHKYIGVPVLSFIGRCCFRTDLLQQLLSFLTDRIINQNLHSFCRCNSGLKDPRCLLAKGCNF